MILIRELREKAGLSLAEVERLSGGHVKQGALKAIERGLVRSPSFALVSALATVLKVPAATCHDAIAATAAAQHSGSLPPRKLGRPAGKAPRRPITLKAALGQARQLCAALEQLATTGGR
jgi:transcriptional regulator with XRE-family HTH domain